MGFGYAPWRGPFYPAGVRQADQLGYYASQFDALELDTTFHAMPTPQRIEQWAKQVDDDFRFAVKTPRVITHEGPLDARRELTQVFLDTLKPMGRKLGAVLLQFPPTFDPGQRGALLRLLDSIHTDAPLTVELRHAGWFTSPIREDLAHRGIALASNDQYEVAQPLIVTSGMLYLRLIGVHDRFPQMNQEELDTDDRLCWWVDRVERLAPSGASVWAIVSNDYAGHAPATARRLKRILGLPEGPRTLHPGRSLFD